MKLEAHLQAVCDRYGFWSECPYYLADINKSCVHRLPPYRCNSQRMIDALIIARLFPEHCEEVT